jgi:hypothetical protein
MARLIRKDIDRVSANDGTSADGTDHDATPPPQPTSLSSMIGNLLDQGRRKAVQELHDKGIETYGWKDGWMERRQSRKHEANQEVISRHA